MTALYDGTANVTVGFRNADYASSNWSGNTKETQQTYKKGETNNTFRVMSIGAGEGYQQASSAGQYGLKLGNGSNQGGALCFYVSAKCEFRIVASTNANGQTIYLYKDASEYSLTTSNYATAGTEISSHTYLVKQTAEAFTGVLESGYYRIASGVNKIWIDTIKLTTYVPVTGISITPSSANVTVGRQVQLSATASPTTASLKTVTWAVKSGGTYASVNSKTGVVRGLAVGDAVITATANDGSGVTQDVNVSVTAIDCDTYSGNLFQMEVLKVCTCTIASGKTFALTDGDNYSVYGGAIALNNKGGSQKVIMSKVQSSLIQWYLNTGDVGFDITLADCNFKKGDIISISSTESYEFYLNDGSAKGASTDATTSSLSYTVDDGDAFIGKNKVVVWKTSSNTYIRSITISRPVTTCTLSASATPDGYGTLTASSIANITSGTAISTSSNVLTVGENSITANPTAQTAQYTYAFSSWLKSDDSALPSTVTADLNVKAVFTRTARTYEVTLHPNDGTINEGDVTSYTFGVGATLPTNVTKASSDFAGWYTDNGVWSDGPYITIANDATGNKEYWAKWTAEAPKHSINYTNDKGATPVAALPTQYAQGTGIASFPALNDVEGWHFTGWSPSSISSSATTDQVIEAQWVPIYNVSFNSNGGSAVAAQHIVSGEAAIVPDPAPTRTNWTFQKWQLNGVDYNFSTAVTESITLDAVWSRNTINPASTGIVISNGTTVNTGGTLSVAVSPSLSTSNGGVKFGGDITTGTNNPTRYVSFTVPEGKTATVNTITLYDANNVIIRNDIGGKTLNDNVYYVSDNTASYNKTFTPGTYYIGRGGSTSYMTYCSVNLITPPLYVKFMNGETKYDSITCTSGETLGDLFMNGELPTLVASGYTFNGWKDKDDNAVSKTTTISASMTIHADWTASTYNLTLSAGENALTDGAGTVQMGASAITIGTATTGTGALKGFYTTSDGNVKVAEADGALVSGNVTDYVTGGKWSRTSDTELFAQYAPSYDVKFFPGYGENDQIGETQSIAGGNFAVAPADPERDGYVFQGWSYDATADHIVTVGSYAISGATNFTAIWKQEFKVKYYDGSTKLGEEIVVDGESPTHAGDFDEKAHCTFDGWFSDADLAPAHAIADVAALVISENTNIYSKWIKSYAQSIDLEQFVIDNKKTGNWHAYLDSKNFTYTTEGDLSLDSLNPDKDANNYSYLGLKIKVSGAYVEGLVEADKLVVIKLGNADKACKLKKNNSDYKSNLSGIPTTATAPAVHYGYDAAEKVYRFQTNGSGAVVLKAFEIIDPYEVTYDAETNGGTCATASVPFHADSLELPAASKDGASFLGWFDAKSAGNKIGEAGDKILPTSAMTLYAQFLETDYVADLTDIQINSESVAGFDRAVISYNKEFAYGSAVPTITYTKAWDDATDVLSLPASLPGNATITVTSENGANVKVYTVHLTVGPKDGIAIISVEITNGNNSEQAVDANKISGFIGGTAVKKIQNGSTKLGSNGHYIGLTLASGYFQAGDKVNINVTSLNDASKVYFYKDAGTNAYETVERAMVVGDNWYDIPAAAIGQNSLYVYRVNDKCNPNVAKFEVYRPMNPVITAFALDGENGSIDEAKKRIVVSLPTDKSLTVNAEPTALTIVSNTDQASVVKSINGGGEWHYGDNTYRVTDKDGDYTEYTVRIYQQTRTGLVAEKMSTSCYPRAISMYRGVTFYELAGGYDVNIASDGDLNGSPTMLLFLEVETLEAGKPYLYVPTEDGVPLEVAFTGAEASEGNYRGFYGSFAGIAAAPDNILLNNFIVYNNIIQRCGENSYIGANRAYFKIEEVPCYSTKEAAYAAAEAAHGGSFPAPAIRRRLAVSNGGHTTPTGLDNISEDELTRLDGQKRIIDGKLFIIRDGHIYNAQGVRVQ